MLVNFFNSYFSGWPLFGNFFSIDFKNPTEKFTEWAHEFGGIFTLNILGQNIVVVSTKESITVRHVDLI